MGRTPSIGFGDDGSPHPHAAAAADPVLPSAPLVVVDPPTVAATRAALDALAAEPGPVRVVGFADLSSPHLVDLLDDLASGPGGNRLWGLGLRCPPSGAGWLDDVPVRRGLACVHRRGLAVVLLGSGPADLVPALTRLLPGLRVVEELAAADDHSPLPVNH